MCILLFFSDFQVGVVTGDDLMPMKNDLLEANLCDLASGLPLPPSAHSINAYLGWGILVLIENIDLITLLVVV